MNNSTISTAIIYLVVFVLIIKEVIKNELYDMNCPHGPNTPDKNVCRDGNGKLWSPHKYAPSDTLSSSIEKTGELVKNFSKAVIWRRTFVFSVMATILVFLTVHRRLPNGFELIGTILGIFTIFYLSNSYYKYHHDRFIEETAMEHLKFISSKVKRK